ncbi:MAG: AraC family transcriptional regulator [Capsulimonadaceae bacterium]|nr:AraC family transcriptional regulator [Capsulimonadaceae bacterium]
MEHSIANLEYLTVAMQSIKHFFLPPAINSPTLSINGLGISEPMRPVVCNRPNGTGDFLLMIYLDPAYIRAPPAPAPWPANTMIIWKPGQPQYYGNPNAPYRHSWMHCDGDAVADALAAANVPIDTPFTLSNPGIVNHYLLEIYREVTEHGTPSERIAINALTSLLADIERQIAGEVPAPPAQLLALRHSLGENIQEPLTLACMARRVNMSPSHFSAEFKRWFGVSPIEYHIQLRLHAASYLLRDGNKAVADVAREVGYDDPFHFSKQFKARFGVRPRDIRKHS